MKIGKRREWDERLGSPGCSAGRFAQFRSGKGTAAGETKQRIGVGIGMEILGGGRYLSWQFCWHLCWHRAAWMAPKGRRPAAASQCRDPRPWFHPEFCHRLVLAGAVAVPWAMKFSACRLPVPLDSCDFGRCLVESPARDLSKALLFYMHPPEIALPSAWLQAGCTLFRLGLQSFRGSGARCPCVAAVGFAPPTRRRKRGEGACRARALWV